MWKLTPLIVSEDTKDDKEIHDMYIVQATLSDALVRATCLHLNSYLISYDTAGQ